MLTPALSRLLVGNTTVFRDHDSTSSPRAAPLGQQYRANRWHLGLASWTIILCLCLHVGCATIPDGRYGVRSFELSGVEQLDPQALRACLVTQERNPVAIGPGAFASRNCGEPPFDEPRGFLRLWTWPWSSWPILERGVFDLDLRRIERWYEARGFYDMQITEVEFEPPAAERSDRTLDPAEPPCSNPEGGCRVHVHLHIREGEPVMVESVELLGIEALPDGLETQLRDSLLIQPEQRFDETLYSQSQQRLQAALGEASYAKAVVTGRVDLDRRRRVARIEYSIDPGPPCRFGELFLEGEEELPSDVILTTAYILPGQSYSESALDDAQRAIYALGAFSSVVIEPLPSEVEDEVIHLQIRVTPLRRQRFRTGVGIAAGNLRRITADERVSIPQWDVHLLFGYEHRNLFGGLRRVGIEDRPRLIMPADFPRFYSDVRDQGPQPGNLLTLNLQQPGFLERRTVLFSDSMWDYGPDPFLGFFRHDLSVNLGLRRTFLRQRLSVQVAVQNDIFLVQGLGPGEVIEPAPIAGVPLRTSSYRLPFLGQTVILDLRDDPRQPSGGAYFSLGAQQAFRLGNYGSWRYLRFTPDARAYFPFLFGTVLATRFAMGLMFILDSAEFPDDPLSETLGPLTYRLRGGGANSVRGFAPGRLGAGLQGGIRRWESSIELRVPLAPSVLGTLFADVGDVNDQPHMRFDHLNTSLGFGFRYLTVVGPIRLDVAWRVPGAQVVGETDTVDLRPWPSAFHLTIGEAF